MGLSEASREIVESSVPLHFLAHVKSSKVKSADVSQVRLSCCEVTNTKVREYGKYVASSTERLRQRIAFEYGLQTRLHFISGFLG